MREFGDLGALAAHLVSDTIVELGEVKQGLEAAAELLEKAAKAEIGTYQEGIGPFAAWAELADATKADRVAKGFTENDPLLRSGELRDSIVHEVEHFEATVGSTDPVMLWQELGTSRMPPRAVLGIALYRNLDRIQQLVGQFAAKGIAGGGEIDPTIGYDLGTGAP